MPDTLIGTIPQLGYGTWNHEGDEAYNGVVWALEAGYRHIDTAQGYRNEIEVGRAIKESGVARSDIHLTTKVAPENYGPGQVMDTSKQSLEDLGVDQVDLLLLHWPSPHNEYPLDSYMSQFAEVFDAGMAKQIGVSNFTIPLLKEAQSILGDRKITTNQCEIHVYMQNRPIVDYCRSIDMPMTAYSPLARGAVKDDAVLKEIGATHGATEAQIAIAFLLAEGHITIPSSSNRERIISNFAARDITLSADEILRLRALERGQRLVNGAWVPVWDV